MNNRPVDLDDPAFVAALNAWIAEQLGPPHVEPDRCPFCGGEDFTFVQTSPDGVRVYQCQNEACPSAEHYGYFDENDVKGATDATD